MDRDDSIKVCAVKTPTVEKLHQDLLKILPGFQSKHFENCVSVKSGDVLVLASGSDREKTVYRLNILIPKRNTES